MRETGHFRTGSAHSKLENSRRPETAGLSYAIFCCQLASVTGHSDRNQDCRRVRQKRHLRPHSTESPGPPCLTGISGTGTKSLALYYSKQNTQAQCGESSCWLRHLIAWTWQRGRSGENCPLQSLPSDQAKPLTGAEEVKSRKQFSSSSHPLTPASRSLCSDPWSTGHGGVSWQDTGARHGSLETPPPPLSPGWGKGPGG